MDNVFEMSNADICGAGQKMAIGEPKKSEYGEAFGILTNNISLLEDVANQLRKRLEPLMVKNEEEKEKLVEKNIDRQRSAVVNAVHTQSERISNVGRMLTDCRDRLQI